MLQTGYAEGISQSVITDAVSRSFSQGTRVTVVTQDVKSVKSNNWKESHATITSVLSDSRIINSTYTAVYVVI